MTQPPPTALATTGVAPSILQTAEMGEPKYLIFITNLLQNTHQLIIKYLFIILHFCKGDAERVRCVCVCVCVCACCVCTAPRSLRPHAHEHVLDAHCVRQQLVVSGSAWR